MNKKTIITLSACIALLVIAVIVYVVLRKKSSAEVIMPENTTSSDQKITGAVSGNKATILKIGSRGDAVKQLQQFLNTKLLISVWSKGYPTFDNATITELNVDGIFGHKTEAVCLWYFGKSSVTMDEIK